MGNIKVWCGIRESISNPESGTQLKRLPEEVLSIQVWS